MNSFIKRRIVFSLFIIVCAILAIATAAQEILKDDPRIGGVITTGQQRMKIGIPEFRLGINEPSLKEKSEELRKILINDLKNSGIFWIVPEERHSWIRHYVGEQPNFEGWLSIEAESLVTGYINYENGRIIFEGRVFDSKSKQMRGGKRYRSDLDQVRIIAHTFANEIVRNFTGKNSFFTTQIVFISDRTGNKEIYLIDYDGSNTRQITNIGSIALFPTFTADRQTIIYTSFHKGFPMLYKMSNVRGSNLQAIPGTQPGDITPAASPDGSKLAFSSNRDGNSEIYIMDLENGNLTRLTNSYAIDASPSWSPNGKNILFTSDRSGSPNIYLTDMDGLEVERLTYDLMYCDHADWSSDGERIVFTGRMRGYFNIFVLELKTSELYQLTINTRNNEDPSWSPDGRKIVFSSDRTGQYQLYIMNADGSDQTRITNAGNNTDPRWSK